MEGKTFARVFEDDLTDVWHEKNLLDIGNFKFKNPARFSNFSDGFKILGFFLMDSKSHFTLPVLYSVLPLLCPKMFLIRHIKVTLSTYEREPSPKM